MSMLIRTVQISSHDPHFSIKTNIQILQSLCLYSNKTILYECHLDFNAEYALLIFELFFLKQTKNHLLRVIIDFGIVAQTHVEAFYIT